MGPVRCGELVRRRDYNTVVLKRAADSGAHRGNALHGHDDEKAGNQQRFELA